MFEWQHFYMLEWTFICVLCVFNVLLKECLFTFLVVVGVWMCFTSYVWLVQYSRDNMTIIIGNWGSVNRWSFSISFEFWDFFVLQSNLEKFSVKKKFPEFLNFCKSWNVKTTMKRKRSLIILRNHFGNILFKIH